MKPGHGVRRVGLLLAAATLGLTLAITGHASSDAHDEASEIAHYGDDDSGVPSCATCHGNQGEGQPAAGFPRLAGLPMKYFERQLDNFASGDRHDPMMTPVAKLLSKKQRKALSQYYATMPAPDKKERKTGQSVTDDIEQLAHKGRWDDDQPGCIQCHGEGGAGAGDDFPPLTGQSAHYLAKQLMAWKQGDRPPGPLSLMEDVAHKLSDSEVRALSEYFAAQPTGSDK